MHYQLEVNLHDDANLEGIAAALEGAANQVRSMSSIASAHGMSLNRHNGGAAVKYGVHGVDLLHGDVDIRDPWSANN